MDIRIVQLEDVIRSNILIPQSLASNCKVTTTGMGGVFIEFYSNLASSLKARNSEVQFRIMFDTTLNNGKFEGTDIGVEMYTHRGIPAPLRAIKKKKPYAEVIIKVNRWLADNELYLFDHINNN